MGDNWKKIKENFKNRTKTYVALKNNNVVGSIPFSVKVLTKIPLDPNIIPAKAGNKK